MGGRHVRRGPGPSSTLITPDRAGNVVGVDPHKRTLTATVDLRGGIVASEHSRVSGNGHWALEAWSAVRPDRALGDRGCVGLGRHTAIFLTGRWHEVRDVCPNRTAHHDRARQRRKSDTLDSKRIARETLAHPLLPRAFKRAGDETGPDEQAELLAVWWNARCSSEEPSAPALRSRGAVGRSAAGADRAAARQQGGAPQAGRAQAPHTRRRSDPPTLLRLKFPRSAGPLLR